MNVTRFVVLRRAQQPDGAGGFLPIMVEVTRGTGDVSIASGVAVTRSAQRGVDITHQISVSARIDIRVGDEIQVGDKKMRVTLVERPNENHLLQTIFAVRSDIE